MTDSIKITLPNTEGELKDNISKEFRKQQIVKITFSGKTCQYGSLKSITEKYVTINRLALIISKQGKLIENSVALNGGTV